MKPSDGWAIIIPMCASRTLVPLLGCLLAFTAGTSVAAELAGHWVLNPELTNAEQPDGPKISKGPFSRMPQTSVSVGGIPLPGTGGSGLPSVAGTAAEPKVLRTSELTIEPQGDGLHLSFPGVGSETLKRGNDQGLVSKWNSRRLTTRYETTSRKVRQTYEVRRDGRLLVTVKLDPNQGAAVTHKRVFDPASADAD